MRYPEYAEIGGNRYKINTDFRVALECFKVIEDATISDQERALAVIYLLFGDVPTDNLDDFLRIAGDYLRCGESDEPKTTSKRDMDLVDDEKYISASFMSDYQIDLSKADMHFWQYINLIQGFTDRCILSRVRDIRNYDMEELKDPKARARMAKAKEAVALPEKYSRAEQEAIDDFEKLFDVG